jgi:Mrp family chromosome partitioning ATPase
MTAPASIFRKSEAPPRIEHDPNASRYLGIASLVTARRAEEPGRRAFVFASATPGEGTTTTTLGVAAALRESYGASVLVVELNFLRPTFAERFALESTASLSAVSSDETSVMNAIRPVPEGFFVLAAVPAGAGAVRNLPEVFSRVVNDTVGMADIVLVDAPPILESSEALAIAEHAPDLFLVAEARKSSSASVDAIKKRLEGSRLRFAGAVLSKQRRILPNWLRRWLAH